MEQTLFAFGFRFYGNGRNFQVIPPIGHISDGFVLNGFTLEEIETAKNESLTANDFELKLSEMVLDMFANGWF